MPAVPDAVPVWPLDVAGRAASARLGTRCPEVEPDCAARVTANAQAMATLDAVVTTRFIWSILLLKVY